MKIVSENYAESLGGPFGVGSRAFLAAVIGEGLRADLDEDAAIPDRFLSLLRTLDQPEQARPFDRKNNL